MQKEHTSSVMTTSDSQLERDIAELVPKREDDTMRVLTILGRMAATTITARTYISSYPACNSVV